VAHALQDGQVVFDTRRTTALLCGPEMMMVAAIAVLRGRGLPDDQIWVSLERNMHCGIGRCGHCQIGPKYVCTDGPVFSYAEIADFLGVRGF
jgi:NAD(P)H-flavin reductase